MQTRVITQLDIRQPGFDTEQRPEKIVSVLLELSLGLFEALEFKIERFLLGDLLWCTAFKAADVLLSGELPFCKRCISCLGENCGCESRYLCTFLE